MDDKLERFKEDIDEELARRIVEKFEKEDEPELADERKNDLMAELKKASLAFGDLSDQFVALGKILSANFSEATESLRNFAKTLNKEDTESLRNFTKTLNKEDKDKRKGGTSPKQYGMMIAQKRNRKRR